MMVVLLMSLLLSVCAHRAPAHCLPDFGEGGLGRGLLGMQKCHGMHRPGNASIPRLAPVLEPLPLSISILQSHMVFLRQGLARVRHQGAEVGNLGGNVDDSIGPELLTIRRGLSRKVHVDAPGIGIPGDLPIEVETAEHFHADVDPEAGSSHAARSRVPARIFDQRSCAGNVVHSLQRALRHDFVDVQDHGRRCTDVYVPVGIVDGAEQLSSRGLVVALGLVFAVDGVDERQMSGSAGQEGVEQHGFVEGMERQDSRKL